MSEIVAIDDEPLPDLDGMVAMAWRRVARAIRAGRAGEALRWLSVHARLEATADAGPPPGPSPVTAGPEPSAPAGAPTPPKRPAAAPQVHQLHQLHRAMPVTPVQGSAAGPDPP
jgi:hypothetical protein